MAEIRTLGTIKTYLTMQLWQNVKDLKELKKDVVFLPVDKVRHDCAVMCKASYCKLLKNEMEGNHLLYLPCLLWSEKKNRKGKLNFGT